MAEVTSHRFTVSERAGEVSALLARPKEARALYVLGHGAGAGMTHAFMEAVVARLSDLGVATFRYQFPYMEQGRKAPGPEGRRLETVRAAVSRARELDPDLPLIAGGKSMGGRMTSLAASKQALEGVRGLAFLGFPLHAPGKPSAHRGEHLEEIGLPMLFLQGTRDNLADLELLRPLLETVRPAPTLHVAEGADHGFHVLKRSGRTDDEVLDEICGRLADWVGEVVG